MFNDVQRSFYLQGLGLDPVVIREIEEMRAESPARPLSQKGLKNILVDFYSQKNGQRRKLESYTVEFLYSLWLELFSPCHEYYVQVRPKNIDRSGRVSSTTADFMVFEPEGVCLVECKPTVALEHLAAKRPDEWVCRDGVWTRPPVEAWANERGLRYMIWCPPEPHGIYQANLLILYAQQCVDGGAPAIEACISRLIKTVEEKPLVVAEALTSISSLSGTHLLKALASKQIFGPLKSIPLDEVDRFPLYASSAQAEANDALSFTALQGGMLQPTVGSPILLASVVDYEHGIKRLERVKRILAGEDSGSRRYLDLVKKVLDARDGGGNELEVCLTEYYKSGRRVSQLTSAQEELMHLSILRYRRDATIRGKVQAHDHLTLLCRNAGVRTPCRATFNARLKKFSLEKRAYTEGGHRGFHAVELATDPGARTLRCFLPGIMVHVDSTKFDERCSPDFLATLGFDCPTLYLAIDSATGKPLGRAILFGTSCRNSLAVLIRDVLHRQGSLPRYWIVDGGSEYTGEWFESFCTLIGATRIQPPPVILGRTHMLKTRWAA
ncbi:hypothetical protein [Rhodanobacter sp. A1T4]|uniref:hypothetical protein n=1 Tax=Rhodanobacter sp. A1T4 TaxID=2723087 RepID=UPI00161540FE|nr:hypothetical protein [Rhodanobacter sp. A1T4]MBB6249154.1 hypothetical protein [Rhodanobacter sp. A1T4]